MKRALPIGIDIGTSSVKMVQLAQDGRGFSVVACAKASTAGLSNHYSAEERESALVEVVRRKLDESSFRGNECISALTSDEVQIRNIRVGCVRAEELDKAVHEEARNKFSFDIDEAILNYLVAGEVRHGEDARLEVILFAAPLPGVEAHVERLHRLGLMPVSLDVPQCAMFRTFERYLRRKEDEGDVNAYVDLGGQTKVVITRGRDILFIKSIETGGRSFDEAVARELNLELHEASALRRSAAADGEESAAGCDEQVRQALLDAIRPQIEDLADQINKCLRYHSVTFRGQRPDKLTFIGGESYDSSLPEMLGRRLSLPVVVGQPFRGIDTHRLGKDFDRRGMLSEWTVAFGLSLKGAYLNNSLFGRRRAG